MALPQFNLSFDIGRGSPELVEIPKLLLTHGHLDHCSGVAYHVSQRSLRHLPPGEIFCPPPMAEPLKKILTLWGEIEGFDFEFGLTPLEYDTYYPLQGNFHFRAIPTLHRVPSNSYTIVEKRNKLKREFRHLPGHEIARLKRERDDLFYEQATPYITFSGDTRIEWLLENEIVRNSKVLFLECTYIDEKRPVERARTWGHIHLDEIAAEARAFENVERLYLIHFSPRYSREQIQHQLTAKLPEWLLQKTFPFFA